MLAPAVQPGSLFMFHAGTYVPVGLAEPRLSSDDRARSVCLYINSDGNVPDNAHVDVYTYVYLGGGSEGEGEVWRPGC